jgi:PAS domain S-box-containing protein
MTDFSDKKSSGPLNPVPSDLLQTLFDSVSEGVFAVDTDYRIIAINESALQTLGIPLHNALGRNCRDVFQADICENNCAVCRVLEKGTPLQGVGASIKNGFGQMVPVTLSANKIMDQAGNVIGGVETFVDLTRSQNQLERLDSALSFHGIVTGDPAMKKLFEILPTISKSSTSILINGETGTGKNLVAKAVHNLSARAGGPLITVNCAALPETLLESELFGYKAGAFTGAVSDRPGRVSAAEGGTLFLDEVGDIPLGMQVKLLRVLQERVYERLGDQKTIPCDVRFITATHRDLLNMVSEGTFRRDLYYRINVLNIDLPPLRERKADIPLLTQQFVDQFSGSRGKKIIGVSSAALECLMAHNYPGNVRELENIIEHAWVMCRWQVIEPEHLPRRLRIHLSETDNGGKTGMNQVEAAFLAQALERNGWHRGKTATELGIHRTTLQRKIKKLGLISPIRDGRFSI